tara:strand:- start:840 stop:1244 length:405 start_codon:yes stop_codon:yes gene_type:complete
MKVTNKSGLSGTANRYVLNDSQAKGNKMIIDIELFTEPNVESDTWSTERCGYCSNDEVGNGEDTYVIVNSSDLVCNNQVCKGDMLEDYMQAETFHEKEPEVKGTDSMWYITSSGQGYDSCCEDDGNECGCSPIA